MTQNGISASAPELTYEIEFRELQEKAIKKIRIATELAEERLMKREISEEDELSEVTNEVLKYQSLVYGLRIKYGIEKPQQISEEITSEEITVKQFFEKNSAHA